MLTHRDLALLTARSRPFSSPDWLYELKWDGYRVLALVGDAVRLLSRQSRDMTAAFPEVTEAVRKLPRGTALDGELVILDTDGKPQFDYLARAWRTTIKGIREAASTRPATLIAFDILFDAGVDVRNEPIEQRKKRLVKRVPSGLHTRPLLAIAAAGSGCTPRPRRYAWRASWRSAREVCTGPEDRRIGSRSRRRTGTGVERERFAHR